MRLSKWKPISIILTICAALLGSAHGQDFSTPRFDRTKLQVSFVALQLLDAGVTEAGFRTGHWIEHNPLISRHSTAARMTYFGVTGVAVIGVSEWAARKGHRKLSLAILFGGIAVETYANCHSIIGFPHS